MFLTSIALFAVLTLLVVYIVKFIKYWTFFNSLPGEPSFHLLFGNLHKYPGPNEEGLAYDYNQALKYRSFHRTWAGPVTPVIVCYHPETVRAVLKSSAPKPRNGLLSSVYDMGTPWLGEGLLFANGDKWSRNRRLLTSSFHFDILKSYITVFNQCSNLLVKKVGTLSEKNEAFDIFGPVSLTSLDIILQCAFSYRSDCQTSGSSTPNVYEHSLKELVTLWTERSFAPHLFIDFVYFRTKVGKRFIQLCDVVHDIAEKIIKTRKDAINEKDSSHVQSAKVKDFLDTLLTAKDEDGQGLSMLEIRNEVDTFLFAGHDTTTSGTAWTLYSLAQHPEYQEKVYEEVVDVMDGKTELEWNDLGKLEFTTMCIKEALRLHSAVPFTERQLAEPLDIVGNTIPAGTLVAVHLWILHHNPHIWDEPNMFDPYRFSPDNLANMDPYQFVPFSAGSRNCIGQNFAMNEMRVTVVQVIRNFQLICDPNEPPARHIPSVTMRTEKGGFIRAVPRKDSFSSPKIMRAL